HADGNVGLWKCRPPFANYVDIVGCFILPLRDQKPIRMLARTLAIILAACASTILNVMAGEYLPAKACVRKCEVKRCSGFVLNGYDITHRQPSPIRIEYECSLHAPYAVTKPGTFAEVAGLFFWRPSPNRYTGASHRTNVSI